MGLRRGALRARLTLSGQTAVSVGAIGFVTCIVGDARVRSIAAFLAVLAEIGVVLLTYRRRHTMPAAVVRNPWVLTFVACALLTLTSASIESTLNTWVSAQVLTAGVAFVAVSLLLVERVQERAEDIVLEAVIGTATMALAIWTLALGRAGLDGPYIASVGATVSIALAAAAALCVVWLHRVDVEAPRLPLLFLLGALVALGTNSIHSLLLALGSTPPVGIGDALLVASAAFATAALVDPLAPRLDAPAITLSTGVDTGRAVVVLLSALVGPILIGVAVVFDLGSSLVVTSIGAVLLTAAVAVHFLRLVRTWGRLEHDVHHDALTGLPNRNLFFERVDLAIQRSQHQSTTFALMFLDLDRFKNVNDSLGHEAGNDLLCGVAERLTAAVGHDGTVARLGGDEFAILVPAIADYRDSEAIAYRILKRFTRPFDIGMRKLYVTPSIGVAHYPTDGKDSATLVENADSAMYRAKERGRNTVELYSPHHRRKAVDRLDLESALHAAVDKNELHLYYQPKVSLKTGAVIGAEALMRWDHPELGSMPPEEFIPVAEENGLIDLLGEWALTEACAQTRRWVDRGHHSVTVAVNLSPRQFQLQRIQDMVARVLRNTDLNPARLELELTENLAVQDAAAVKQTLREIRALGVRLAVDDFGVGYAGLEYLDRFTFDAIKIDKKFVRRINPSGAPIVTAVIAMAKGLDLEVIAEGVETRAQLDFLRRAGCDVMQGYLFSRPVDVDRMTRMLEESGRLTTQSSPLSEHGIESVAPADNHAVIGDRPW